MAKIFSSLNTDSRPGCTEYTEIDFTGFSPFTLCAWAKFTALNANTPIAVKWGSTGQYGMWILSKKFYIAVKDGASAREAYSVSDYDTGLWNHAALVFNGSAVKLHINAGITEEVTGGTVTGGISNSAENFQISQYSSGGTGSTLFNGSISHVCIFDKALTNNELFDVMISGPRSVSNLVLWFPMLASDVAEVNLAPIAGKTSILGVNTAFTMDTNLPPMGSIFGVTTQGFSLAAGTPSGVASADDLAQPWTDALSTGLGVTRISFSDTLTLTEAQLLGLGLKFPSETLTLTDAFTYAYNAPATPLSVVIVDKIIRNGSINGNNLALRDGFSFYYDPGLIHIGTEDLGTYLDDSNLLLGYGLAVAD